MATEIALDEFERLVGAAASADISQADAVRLQTVLNAVNVPPQCVGLDPQTARLVDEIASGCVAGGRSSRKRRERVSLHLALPRSPDGALMFVR